MVKKFIPILKFSLIFIIVFAWIFAGWPRIWPLGELGVNTIRIPPEVQEAQAAISFVQSKNGTNIGNTTVSVMLDSQATAGNLLVAVISTSADSTMTISGFTPLTRGATSTSPSPRSIRMFYKIAAGGEQTITSNKVNTNKAMIVAEYSGVNADSPLDVENAAVTASGTTHATPIVSVTANNSLVVFATVGTIASQSWSNQQVNSSTTDVAERGDTQTASNTLQMADKLVANSGNTSGSAVISGSAVVGAAAIAVFKLFMSPTFEQAAYRFFNNLDSTDVGTVLADQNASTTLGSTGALFRLRMLLHIGTASLAINGQQFKLQYVGKGTGTCASPTGGTPATYTDVTTSTLIAYNSQTPADGVALTINANDPIHTGDTFAKLTDPTGGLPPSNGKGTAFSADGVYLAIASEEVSPYLAIYKRTGDAFAKLTNPTDLPTGSGRDAAFSADGVYLAIAHYVTPYVTIYKRTGDSFAKLSDPTGGLPAGDASGVAFSADGVYLAVTHLNTPFVTIYKRTGDSFAKLDDPTGGLPASDGLTPAFSGDGVYLAVASGGGIYKRTGDAFAKLTTLDGGNGAAFSDDGVYFAVGYSSTPFISIYKRTGDSFAKLADPGGLPANITGKRVAFSSEGVYLALFHHETPYVDIYNRSGDTFTKLTNPTSLPPGHGYSGAFSADGVYLAVGHQSSPYVSIYNGVANQTYEEENNFTNSISAIPAGMDGKWDFALKDNSAPANTDYCFRVVKSDNSVLDTYTVYPQITTAGEGEATVSISVSPTSTIYGFMDISSVKKADTTNGDDEFIITNTGNVAETFDIISSDASGGAGWTLSTSTVGSSIFMHAYSALKTLTATTTLGSVGEQATKWVALDKDPSYRTLATNVASSTAVDLILELLTPSDMGGDYIQKTITVTVRASEYP